MRTAMVAILVMMAGWAVAQDSRYTVLEPTWDALEVPAPDDLRAAWRQAVTLLNDSTPRASSQGGARVRATFTGHPGAWAVILQLEGVNPPPTPKYLPFAAIDGGLPLEWSRAVEALLRSATAPTPQHLVLVDELALGELEGVDLPAGASVQPTGLASRNGRLVVAGGSTVVEFDERWRVTGLPAKALTDAGQVNFAWGLAQTPAGTLFVRSVDGSAVWSLTDGADRPQRVRVSSPAGSVLGVLGDGSVFVASQPKTVQLWRSGAPVNLPLPPEAVILAAAPGPDNTLWLADAVRGQIRVVTPEALVRDVIFPDLPAGNSILKLRVLADGSFVAVTTNELRLFDPRGRTVWRWDGKEQGLNLTFSMYSDVVQVDGLWYVSDFLGKRVFRLAPSETVLKPALAAVAQADAASRSDSRRAEPFLALADAYKALGSPEAERLALDRYLELRPADGAAVDRRLAVEVELLKAKAAAGESATKELVARYGVETAREAYSRAMKTLEAARALAPQDTELASRMESLRRTMASAPAPAEKFPLVVKVDLPALFPSLLQAYRTRPAGSLVLRNTLSEAITDVSVDVLLPKYMDFATPGPVVAKLAPGAEVKIDLSAWLNDKVLDVEEDVPVQVLFTVHFTDRSPRSFQFPRPVVLYRRTALTWDDTGKLAGFVTPNEETVSRAAFQLLPTETPWPHLSATVQRAADLCDALGALPLRYVPDPQSSFADAASNATIVDTVRFPRTTLAYRGGDCDDTTALLASLLEASGIRTALLTSPGHVFLAFDTGEKPEAAWLFEGKGLAVLKRAGSLWLPLESTDLTNGFVGSWRAASALVETYEGTADFEFLPLASLRSQYPALPLPPSSLPGPRPDPEAVGALRQASSKNLDAALFEPVVGKLQADRASLKGVAWARASNKLAQAQARFGRPAAATATLQAVLAADKTFVAAYLNLASLSLRAGQRDEASRWVDAALRAVPNSAQAASFASQTGLSSKGPALVQAPQEGGRAGTAPLPAWTDD